MSKLIIALSLLFGCATAMGIYGGEKNGCEALIIVGDPTGPDITFKCYGAEVTASVGDSKYCGEL